MAPVRISTSTKKKGIIPASSKVRKQQHPNNMQNINNHILSDQACRDTVDALDDTTAQNDLSNSPPIGKGRAHPYESPRNPTTSLSHEESARKYEELEFLDDAEMTIADDDADPDNDSSVIINLTRDPKSEPTLEKNHVFPFLKLPSELRRQIYQELVPCGYDIFYNRNRFKSNPMCVTAKDKDGNVYKRSVWRQVEEQWRSNNRSRAILVELTFPPVEFNIFLVNKVICNEARVTRAPPAILYGQNTFNFTITSVPKKYDKTNVFGLFDDPTRKHLLRDLRIIALHVEVNDGSTLAIKRHKERLQQFVQELQKYSHDSNKKSLLEKLKVDWFATSLNRRGHRFHVPGMSRGMGMRDTAIRSSHEAQRKYIFGLEGLTALSGVEEVEITGAYVPSWFIECLTRCLRGCAELPRPIDYPEILVRRKNRDKGNGARRTYRMVEMTTKKWCDPWLNWTEFADAEGIEIPEIDRLRLMGLGC
ncbi:uncharacterized protein N0V89_008433 [Didymosphaeria variabile]|uniref:Uncharacterized protein n=1 Tax=Didymosphaeria variabile TaxID=1932322 RepID=A0A9W8XHK3_9PLEO|nr:uncharacterized protein N0V89_008433 [Didymosphaeria variabile]KAJ4349814.1 hypothetical protein N0V89_008433 [Didymosphaeria variabile]